MKFFGLPPPRMKTADLPPCFLPRSPRPWIAPRLAASTIAAVSWGKVDPDRLPDAVVCYVDATVALPLITSYALARHEPRELKRLYERRDELMGLLLSEYEKSERR